MADGRQWLLKRGAYLGDVSALCFLRVPNVSSLPFLLAGTGSQILLYNIGTRKMLKLFNIFDGIRVHGIFSTALLLCQKSSKYFFRIAVYGEKCIKVFHLFIDYEPDNDCFAEESVELLLVHSLPRFSHWVMDVRILKVDELRKGCDDEGNCLAIGLIDNSICLWDICEAKLFLQVHSADKCLLYSMRFWGDNLKSLRVASGTIYNEILVWTIVGQKPNQLFSIENSTKSDASQSKYLLLNNLEYTPACLVRLAGHEGSIFRISWSSDGSQLMSVSDDRSARIWTLVDKSGCLLLQSNKISSELVLFGHSARIWDCEISLWLVVTASEDCTYRIWGVNGDLYHTVKEHTGRGIWRCLYDPTCSILVTAGFDSGIKVHPLAAYLFHPSNQDSNDATNSNRRELFNIQLPKTSSNKDVGGMTSKSEYVRCLVFARQDTLYVSTNHGYLYHLHISTIRNVSWTKLIKVFEGEPIICMDVVPFKSSNYPHETEDWVAVGDGKGNTTIVKIVIEPSGPHAAFCHYWMAERERQLLGIYWCKPTCSHLFTADPAGNLKLWSLFNHSSFSDKTVEHCKPHLVAKFKSCFGARIVCVATSLKEEMIVCGDQRGNLILILFSMGKSMSSVLMEPEETILPCIYFKGAHGISSVTSISISTFNRIQILISSTGKDGCICYFLYGRQNESSKTLNFVGLKSVQEISAVESFRTSGQEGLGNAACAIGFASAEFIIWDLVNEIKILQVPCGGWRRPYSYLLGDTPEVQNCFGFVKDHVIHIHRVWEPSDNDNKFLPQLLHMQFHGREIHTLRFISSGSQSSAWKNGSSERKIIWIATGSEDGTVRLTRYAPGEVGNWSLSKLLGEHVGGSAVRSIYFVEKAHVFDDKDVESLAKTDISHRIEDSPLLISAGAKRLLTCWLFQYTSKFESSEKLGGVAAEERSSNLLDSSGEQCASISFHWLSSHMPSKFSSTCKKLINRKPHQIAENPCVHSSETISSPTAENGNTVSELLLLEESENDWRYLSVTAFLVRSTDSLLLSCFVVVSCSDATLTLRALLLPCRLWFDVAVLAPQTSPILALHHMVVSAFTDVGSLQIGNRFLVVGGSTDGSISFWDLTETIKSFMFHVSEMQPEKFINFNGRPRTGRGSQGGRWWKSLTKDLKEDHAGGNFDCNNKEEQVDPVNPFNEVHEVQPFHTVDFVHQSGINCLHISQGKGSVYHVISGGDDQAVHCLAFQLELKSIHSDNVGIKEQKNGHVDLVMNQMQSCPVLYGQELEAAHHEDKKCNLRCLYKDTVTSAHSSAVKGVWTDGAWAFTTGLYQRVRCWHIGESGKLIECAHLVVDVPEPETLDVQACERNLYWIAIGGRGMQMVEFVPPSCHGDLVS